MKRSLVAFAVLGLLVGWRGSAHAALFGPGPHWVDDVTQGFDYFSWYAVIEIDFADDGAADVTAHLCGPTTVWRSDAMDDSLIYPGLRPNDGQDDVVDTEIVSMSLTGSGMTLRAGDGIGNGTSDDSLFSSGAVAEQAYDDQQADSFFDVFFEIDIPDSELTLYNKEPHRMGAVVEYFPPLGFTYVLAGGPIPLYDKDTDELSAEMVSSQHTPIPEPASVVVWGLLAALGISLGWRRRKRETA